MRMRLGVVWFSLLACCASSSSFAATPSRVERLSEEVLVVRDDDGNWAGGSKANTHQVAPGYEARKVLDLGGVAERDWKATTVVRLSAYLCVRDYSVGAKPKRNGLDEAIEVVANGKVHRFPTKGGLPVFRERTAMSQNMKWHDFALSKAELRRGPNEFIFRKAAGGKEKPDDYLYLGIDNSVKGGRSWVKFSGGDWQQDKLTVPGGTGEYMVRLHLIRGAEIDPQDHQHTKAQAADRINRGQIYLHRFNITE